MNVWHLWKALLFHFSSPDLNNLAKSRRIVAQGGTLKKGQECCSLQGGAEAPLNGEMALHSARVYVFEDTHPFSDSGEEAEASSGRGQNGQSGAFRLLKSPFDRLSRAASAPVPPLLGLLSRTGLLIPSRSCFSRRFAPLQHFRTAQTVISCLQAEEDRVIQEQP